MSPGLNDDDQTEELLTYFEFKILNIRNSLKDNVLHKMSPRNILGTLQIFRPVTSDELKKIINKLNIKSCELDIVPTTFIKNIWKTFCLYNFR